MRGAIGEAGADTIMSTRDGLVGTATYSEPFGGVVGIATAVAPFIEFERSLLVLFTGVLSLLALRLVSSANFFSRDSVDSRTILLCNPSSKRIEPR